MLSFDERFASILPIHWLALIGSEPEVTRKPRSSRRTNRDEVV